jgi:putative endonuclease
MPRSRSATGASARLRAELFGRRGEAIAAWYLRLKGYAILAARYRTPSGEIDLVVRRGGAIVFVEVKSRLSARAEGEALGAVNARRIAAAAGHYLARHPRLAGRDCRFDVIFLAPFRLPRHVKNAFPAA